MTVVDYPLLAAARAYPSGLLLTFCHGLNASVGALTLKAYKSAGSRFERWLSGLPERVFNLPSGSKLHPYSIQVVICYIVYLYKTKKSISTVLHVLGYVNMHRLRLGFSRLVSHSNWAIVHGFIRPRGAPDGGQNQK